MGKELGVKRGDSISVCISTYPELGDSIII